MRSVDFPTSVSRDTREPHSQTNPDPGATGDRTAQPATCLSLRAFASISRVEWRTRLDHLVREKAFEPAVQSQTAGAEKADIMAFHGRPKLAQSVPKWNIVHPDLQRGLGLLTDNVAAIAAMAADIQMKMGLVVRIGIGAQNRCEPFAGGCMDTPQEPATCGLLPPILLD